MKKQKSGEIAFIPARRDYPNIVDEMSMIHPEHFLDTVNVVQKKLADLLEPDRVHFQNGRLYSLAHKGDHQPFIVYGVDSFLARYFFDNVPEWEVIHLNGRKLLYTLIREQVFKDPAVPPTRYQWFTECPKALYPLQYPRQLLDIDFEGDVVFPKSFKRFNKN